MIPSSIGVPLSMLKKLNFWLKAEFIWRNAVRITVNEKLETIAELSIGDISKLLLGRVVKVPGHPVHLVNRPMYEALNIDALPPEAQKE